MNSLSDNEIKEIELGILKKFDSICKENNLKYSLAYGTMLGAVRHHGFIPWDDDVDVFMPREDYEKLLDLKYVDSKYEIKSYRYSPSYYYPYSKMIDKDTLIDETWRIEKNMGLFIDIFPLDSFEVTSKSDKEKIINELNTLSTKAYLMGHKLSHHKSISTRYFIKLMYLLLTYPFKRHVIANFDNHCKNFNAGNSCAMMLQPTDNPFFDKSLFYDYNTVIFEGHSFPIFSEYDAILKQEYGDYMTPPPKEEQISNHFFKAYRKI